jgi:acetylornithine deacetylase
MRTGATPGETVAAEAGWTEDLCVQTLSGAYARERPPTLATTDTRHFVSMGIPAVCFGPRGEGIHGIDERVSLRSVVESAQVLGLFVRNWCGLAPGRKEES